MIRNNIQIARVLIEREWRVIAGNLRGDIINGFIMVGLVYVSFGLFGKHSSISQEFAAAAYIGSVMTVIVGLAYGRGFVDISDYHFGKFFEYRRSLLLTTRWLLLVYLISYTMHFALVTLPLLFASKLFFYELVRPTVIDLLYGGIIYMGALVFVAASYLNFVFLVSFNWFLSNMWQRVNTPLMLLGSMLYSWQDVYRLSNRIGILFLINPITYITEGVRNTLLHRSSALLSGPICLAMIWVFAGVSLMVLFVFTRRRIDA